MLRQAVHSFLLTALMGQAVLAAPTNATSSAKVHWLGDKPDFISGVTFGVPWPRSKHFPENTQFSLSGQSADLQSWVTGYWPDGSVKWTGHAIAGSDSPIDEYVVKATTARGSINSTASTGAGKKGAVVVTESADGIEVGTGKVTAVFPKKGSVIVKSIESADGKQVAQNGRLVLHSQTGVSHAFEDETDTPIKSLRFQSSIDNVTVSEQTSVRALVTVRGKHEAVSGSHDPWLPFVLRFYLYSNSESIKIIHSLVFDGDASKDFVSGLGLRFDVPLKGEELYNRHVRIAGVEGGLLSEAVQPITGQRRDPGQAVKTAQFDGKELPDVSTWDTRVSSRLHWIPAWNDYSLSQLSPDGFTIKKRTKSGQSWINVPAGTRAEGLVYLGGATKGGLAVGLRDFWKRYPTGFDIAQAASDTGSITLWLYSPSAEPLDLRPYHDGLGQKNYTDELDALEITYEDWEKDFDTPYGIARTSEIYLVAFDQTPSREKLASFVSQINNPPVLVPESAYIRETKAIGTYWAPADSTSTASKTLEEHLDFLAKFYQYEVEHRRWYGFLDYGDFMHAYDVDRHTWRYDVGGYAWDNSELSPDLFFWQYFLRTGREDIYRFAEALTRHTGEVDVYHLGNWKGLGTRHGVQHFSDSAKQARISQPQYRKYFFYLSGGDERIGELFEELLDTDKTYGVLDPQRKVRKDGWKPTPDSTVAFGLGTDWSSLAGGWLIDWERRGPRWEESKAKLTKTVQGIANMKNGFVTGSGLYDLKNWDLGPPPTDPDNKGVVSISHLSAVFGLPEVVSELIEYYADDLPKGFKQAWLDYCYYFSATKEEQKARYGVEFGKLNLYQGHSRLTAYASHQLKNETIADRAWKEFFETDGFKATSPWATTPIAKNDGLIPGKEASWVSTNDVAQYGLAVIQNLALVKDALENYGA
ncbi:hypothetical protein NCS57_01336500 [Fusarium keratoplasticum]|uniref:Uncharacterized protein n=1 Tax=Fusarium keratoplasticum TaxID=1328300 RepID=A0ACC0QFY8_9HYPO|nr:hypothetical protein NCS57_01336500 [Fusarium keratoplasticum]KAI8652716.1 hypothetical protein NCS57_01336500 [Fusarium keratoplasticum]KAI8653430.1 hypothetical protein NCS55_01329200 [Fusarium keratoplasticum]